MRLTELALPATIHSTLTDANDARYFEIAHAQNVGVAQQLKDGIRVLDVRPWRSQEYTGWYSGESSTYPHSSFQSLACQLGSSQKSKESAFSSA